MMRIARAEDPDKEIADALSCVDEKGYCWWGTHSSASYAEEILIVQIPYQSLGFASGVLKAELIADYEEIPEVDFDHYRPKSWTNERTYGRYYKIIGGHNEKIPLSEIERENGTPFEPRYHLRSNVMVRLRNRSRADNE